MLTLPNRYSVAFPLDARGAISPPDFNLGPSYSGDTSTSNFSRQHSFYSLYRSASGRPEFVLEDMPNENAYFGSSVAGYNTHASQIPHYHTQSSDPSYGFSHIESEIQAEARAIHDRYFGSFERNDRTRDGSKNSLNRNTAPNSRPNSYHNQVPPAPTSLEIQSPASFRRQSSGYPQHMQQSPAFGRGGTRNALAPAPVRPLSDYFTPSRTSAFHQPATRIIPPRQFPANHSAILTTTTTTPPSEAEHKSRDDLQTYEHETSGHSFRENGTVQSRGNLPGASVLAGEYWEPNRTTMYSQTSPDVPAMSPYSAFRDRRPSFNQPHQGYPEPPQASLQSQQPRQVNHQGMVDFLGRRVDTGHMPYGFQSSNAFSSNDEHTQNFGNKIKCDVSFSASRGNSAKRYSNPVGQSAQGDPHAIPNAASGGTFFTFENLGDEQPDLVDVYYHSGKHSQPNHSHSAQSTLMTNPDRRDLVRSPHGVWVRSNSERRRARTASNATLTEFEPRTDDLVNVAQTKSNFANLNGSNRSLSNQRVTFDGHEGQIKNYSSLPKSKNTKLTVRPESLADPNNGGRSYEELLQSEIEQLTNQLENEQQNLERERMTVAELQRGMNRHSPEDYREVIQQQLEEEKELREEAESRVRDLIEENEASRSRLQALHTQLAQLSQKSNQLLSSLHKPTLRKSNNGGRLGGHQSQSMQEIEKMSRRIELLEAENRKLCQTSNGQKESYEKCLDEVTEKVSSAISAQKDLQSECKRLKDLVKELEQENRNIKDALDQKTSEVQARDNDHRRLLDELELSSQQSQQLARKHSTARSEVQSFHETQLEEILNVLDQIAPTSQKQDITGKGEPYTPRNEPLDGDVQRQRPEKPSLEHSNSSHSNSADSAVIVAPSSESSRVSNCGFVTSVPKTIDPRSLKPANQPEQSGVNDVSNPTYMDIVQSPPVSKKRPEMSYLHLESKFRNKYIPAPRAPNTGKNIKTKDCDPDVTPTRTDFQQTFRVQQAEDDSGQKRDLIREELYEFLPMPPSASKAQEQLNSAFSIPSSMSRQNSVEEAVPRRSNSLQEYNQGHDQQVKSGQAGFRPRIPRRAPLTPPVTSNHQVNHNQGRHSHTGTQANSRTSLGSNGPSTPGPESGNQMHANESSFMSPRVQPRQSRLPTFGAKNKSQNRSSSASNNVSEGNKNTSSSESTGFRSPFNRRRSSSRQKKNKPQTPPALPPNHPTSPMLPQRRDVAPSDNHGNNTQHPQDMGAVPDNMNFNRVLSHHDPWIREIARKYVSPPQSPDTDLQIEDVFEEQRSRSNTLTQNNESDSEVNQVKQGNGSKIPQKQQSSIPVKRGNTPVNKSQKRGQKSNENSSANVGKNKKSLKLKIPSLLKKHTSSAPKYNSSPTVAENLVNQNVKPLDARLTDIAASQIPRQTHDAAMSPRLLRNPPIRYNHLVDPRQSMPAKVMPSTPEVQRRTRQQVPFENRQSDNVDETFGDSSTLVENVQADGNANGTLQKKNSEEIQDIPNLPFDREMSRDNPSYHVQQRANSPDPYPVAIPDTRIQVHSFAKPGSSQNGQTNISNTQQEPNPTDVQSGGEDNNQELSSRSTYLEQWIDNQPMTASSEDDHSYPDSSSTDQYPRRLPNSSNVKSPGAKQRPPLKDVEFNRFGPQEDEALNHFNFLSDASSPASEANKVNNSHNQNSLQQSEAVSNDALSQSFDSYQREYQTFTTAATGATGDDLYFSDSLCNDSEDDENGEEDDEDDDSEDEADDDDDNDYMVIDPRSVNFRSGVRGDVPENRYAHVLP